MGVKSPGLSAVDSYSEKLHDCDLVELVILLSQFYAGADVNRADGPDESAFSRADVSDRSRNSRKRPTAHLNQAAGQIKRERLQLRQSPLVEDGNLCCMGNE